MDDVEKCFLAYEKCIAAFERGAAAEIHPVFVGRQRLARRVSDLGLATLSDIQNRVLSPLERITAGAAADLQRAQAAGEAARDIRTRIDELTPDNERWLAPLISYELAHEKAAAQISIVAAELMDVNLSVVRAGLLLLPPSLGALYESRDPSVWADQIIGLGKAFAGVLSGEMVSVIEAIFEPIRKKARRLREASDELTAIDKYVVAVWSWSVSAEIIAGICDLVADAASGAARANSLSVDAIRSEAEANVQRRFRELCAGTWTQD